MKSFLSVVATLIFMFFLMQFVVTYKNTEHNKIFFFLEHNGQSNLFWKAVFLFTVTIIGIVFGHIYTTISIQKTEKLNPQVFSSALSGREFWRSLFASPIIFGSVYIMAKEQPDIVISGILAFENGFFCQAILRKRKKESTEK